MTDYRALVDEAREWGQREAEELGEDSYSARTLTELADAVESQRSRIAALEAENCKWGDEWVTENRRAVRAEQERDLLRKQFRTLTSFEWTVTVPALADVPGTNIMTEEEARDAVRNAKTEHRKWTHGNPAVAWSRLVGPWIQEND